MEVKVRKNNVGKALSILNKKLAEDGDLRRYAERQQGYLSKGQRKRLAKKRGIAKFKKQQKEALREQSN